MFNNEEKDRQPHSNPHRKRLQVQPAHHVNACGGSLSISSTEFPLHPEQAVLGKKQAQSSMVLQERTGVQFTPKEEDAVDKEPTDEGAL